MARDYEIYPGFYRNQSHTHKHIEQRAPTDESVRLLKEFGDAARDQIVGVFRNKDNGIDFSSHVFRDASNPFDAIIRVRCSVNGRSIDFTFSISLSLTKQEMAKLIIDRLSQKIAGELVITNLNSFDGIFK